MLAEYMGVIGDFKNWVLELVRQYPNWTALIVLALAFGESLAFVSLIFPFWGIMVLGIGPLVGASDALNFWTIVSAAAIGAALGDWLSYWLGYHYHEQIQRMWPLRNHPNLIDQGRVFFKRWGAWLLSSDAFSGPFARACRSSRASPRCPVSGFKSPIGARPSFGPRCFWHRENLVWGGC